MSPELLEQAQQVGVKKEETQEEPEMVEQLVPYNQLALRWHDAHTPLDRTWPLYPVGP